MFDFGLSYKDFSRIAWTFVQAFLAVVFLANGDFSSPKALLIGAVAAGLSAVKNFVLAENSPIK